MSALLWLAVVFITIRSFWFTDTVAVWHRERSPQHGGFCRNDELSFHRGRFYVRAWLRRDTDSFDYDVDWSWWTSRRTSKFANNMERVAEKYGVHRRQFLGFHWARGDPDTLWLRFIRSPIWPLLLPLTILPGFWLWRRRSWSREQRRTARRWLLLTCSVLVGIPAILLGLMFVNTTFLGPGEKPLSGQTSHRAVWPTPDPNGIVIKVMTYNIWMGGAYRGGWRFEKPERVAERTRDIGEFIKEHEPDLVFLQEVVMESGPGSVNQTPLIATAAGMHAWAFGEVFNHGLPFYRMIQGNAILSRWPLVVGANQPMAGRSPFYRVGVANQRTLWCKIRIAEHEVLVASVHLSSAKDQYRQMQQILDFVGERPAILAGDFNARPTDTAIKLLVDTGRFSAKLDGPPTMSSHQPNYKIDYIFAPRGWELIEHKVVQTDLSDHLPILSTFRIPLDGTTKK